MADVVSSSPQRKRKVEASVSSACAPKGNSCYTAPVWDLDDEMDPADEQEYSRQVRESDGFDVDDFPYAGITPQKCLGTPGDTDITLYGRLGLHCYNIQKGKSLQLMHLEKLNVAMAGLVTYYITLKAMDPASGSLHTFQTCVSDVTPRNRAQLITEIEVCRLKPTTPGFEVSGLWKEEAVGDFYKGYMPNWDDKLQDCYKVLAQALDSAGYDRLRLYCEVALYYKVMNGTCSYKMCTSSTPLEMKEVYVQSQENVSPIWNAENAIFYIRFRPGGSAREYKAIVRKTMDGQPGHLRLETNVLNA